MAKTKQRGRSRVRRHTYDIDHPRAQVNAQLGGDGSLESSSLTAKAIVQTLQQARALTAAVTRYGQGAFTRVAQDVVTVLLDPEQGFDHFTGTNDLAGSQIAKLAACSKRQWQRVKVVLKAAGVIDYVHRSVKSGLPDTDPDIQISDLYSFTPERMQPWLRQIFDGELARLKARVAARLRRDGLEPRRTPLVKRDRPHRRIPALLNPIGWAMAVAGGRAGAKSYAEREAESLAFATQLALKGVPG